MKFAIASDTESEADNVDVSEKTVEIEPNQCPPENDTYEPNAMPEVLLTLTMNFV